MHELGIVLVIVSLFAGIFGLLQQRKAKKIAAAPFHKTGELAANPSLGGAKGFVSTEGAPRPVAPFQAPCSGQACVYYEVSVEKVWEKQVRTENGYKTERGSSRVRTDKAGTSFVLDDSSGPITVDAREKVSAKLKESFGQTQNVSHGDVIFGQYRAHVPASLGEERVTGIKVTEQIFAPTSTVFAMGKLAGGVLTTTDGLLGGLELHEGGRDQLLGRSARNAKIGLIAAAATFVPGLLGTLLFKAAPSVASASSCETGITDTTSADCDDRVYDDNGKTYPWKVTKAAIYTLHVGTPAVTSPLDAEITVKDATGKVVASSEGNLNHPFVPGTYSVNVHDETKGRAPGMKGGLGFTLKVTSAPSDPPAVAAATPPAADPKPASATTPAAAEPAHGAPPGSHSGAVTTNTVPAANKNPHHKR